MIVFILLFYYFLSNIPRDEELIAKIIVDSKNETFRVGNLNDPMYLLSGYIKARDKTKYMNHDISNSVLVYIYSTHEKESYSDNGLSEYHIKPNVKMMDYILKDYLEEYGIYSYVEDESVTDILNRNGWAYRYSYEASKTFIPERIKEYPELKLIIDLHRDSSSLDKTLLYSDKKYARILFVVGGEHDNYQVNYQLAKELSDLLNNKVSNISRGVLVKKGEGVNGIYNQNLSNYSVLIELGGQYNELEELNNSLEVLASVIYEYLGE